MYSAPKASHVVVVPEVFNKCLSWHAVQATAPVVLSVTVWNWQLAIAAPEQSKLRGATVETFGEESRQILQVFRFIPGDATGAAALWHYKQFLVHPSKLTGVV